MVAEFVSQRGMEHDPAPTVGPIDDNVVPRTRVGGLKLHAVERSCAVRGRTEVVITVHFRFFSENSARNLSLVLENQVEIWLSMNLQAT